MWLAARARAVPVLVGPDRGLVGLRAVAQFDSEILVLDDGFHHHRVVKDLDLVTLDGRFGMGNGRVLPRGPLREPADALRHADGFIVVDPPLQSLARKLIEHWRPEAPSFGARRRTARLWLLGRSSHESQLPVSMLQGAKVGILASIARPEAFRATLEELGAEVVASRTFHDHHQYRARDLRGLATEAPTWVTTEKDAMKLRTTWAGPVDIWVVGLDLELADAGGLLAWVEEQLALGA
jgi:tetraacyldisaccharide 4'-kinase